MCEYIFKNEGGCLKTTHCNIKYTVFVSDILMVLSCWFHFHQTVLGFVEGKAVSFLDFPATGSGYLVKTGIPTHSGRVKTQDVIQGKWW